MAGHILTTPLLFLLSITFAISFNTSIPTFDTWKDLHNKTYTDEKEETLRRQIYDDNRRFVMGYQEEGSVILELGSFADLTHEEFLGVAGIRREETGQETGRNKFRGAALYGAEDEELKVGGGDMLSCEKWYGGSIVAPSSINWKTKGAVTGVLKQTYQCPGNSYAIAALGAVTGQWYQRSGRRVAFSEQQVVDCSQKFGNRGCHSGSPVRTYSYIKKNGGIATRLNYPTKGAAGQCKTNIRLGPTVTGCRYVAGNEKTLKELVGTVGPVAAVIDVSPRSFQFYKSGVYHDRTCHPPYADHHVLITGYGTQYDRTLGRVVDYWLIKNCWGTQWGDKGYMKIIRNNYNHCGIANHGTVPYVAK